VNAPGLLAANWFGAHERDIATTVASLFAVIGNAVGQVMPPAMVDSEVTDDDGNVANGDDDVNGMEDLLLFQAILSLLCFLGVWVYFVSHPPTSPSSSTEERDKIKEEVKEKEAEEEKAREKGGEFVGVLDEAKKPLMPASSFNDDASLITVDVTVTSEINRRTAIQSPGSIEEEDEAALRRENNSKYGHLVSAGIELFKDPNYRLLFLAFGLGLALFNALLTVVNNILAPCGYSEDDAGGFAAALIGAGLLGAAFAGYAMDTYHAYRPLLKAGFSCAAVTCFILASSIKEDNSTMLYVVFGMLGFFMIPMLPVMIENSIECSYPISEELSAGILFCAGNVIGIPVTFLMQYLIDLGGDDACGNFASPVNILIITVAVFCSFFVLQYNGPYKRLIFEKKKLLEQEGAV